MAPYLEGHLMLKRTMAHRLGSRKANNVRASGQRRGFNIPSATIHASKPRWRGMCRTWSATEHSSRRRRKTLDLSPCAYSLGTSPQRVVRSFCIRLKPEEGEVEGHADSGCSSRQCLCVAGRHLFPPVALSYPSVPRSSPVRHSPPTNQRRTSSSKGDGGTASGGRSS